LTYDIRGIISFVGIGSNLESPVARCVEDVIAIYNEEFPYSPHTQTEELGTAWWKIPDGPVLFAR